MSQHPKVIGAMTETAARMGTGAGGTRNIAGTNLSVDDLRGQIIERLMCDMAVDLAAIGTRFQIDVELNFSDALAAYGICGIYLL